MKIEVLIMDVLHVLGKFGKFVVILVALGIAEQLCAMMFRLVYVPIVDTVEEMIGQCAVRIRADVWFDVLKDMLSATRY